MNKIAKDFAEYMLSDCKNCREHKDGLCMSNSRCFAAKHIAIEALRMINNKTEQESKTEDDILKAVKDNCNKRPKCKGCKYLNNDTLQCKFRDIPLTWEIE